jgi:hypothetical protein
MADTAHRSGGSGRSPPGADSVEIPNGSTPGVRLTLRCDQSGPVGRQISPARSRASGLGQQPGPPPARDGAIADAEQWLTAETMRIARAAPPGTHPSSGSLRRPNRSPEHVLVLVDGVRHKRRLRHARRHLHAVPRRRHRGALQVSRPQHALRVVEVGRDRLPPRRAVVAGAPRARLATGSLPPPPPALPPPHPPASGCLVAGSTRCCSPARPSGRTAASCWSRCSLSCPGPRASTSGRTPVVIHRWFRSGTVAWRDVADVRVDRSGLAVVLERADGWRVELGYPRRGLFALNRRRFDAHYRGAGWNHAWRGSVPRA